MLQQRETAPCFLYLRRVLLPTKTNRKCWGTWATVLNDGNLSWLRDEVVKRARRYRALEEIPHFALSFKMHRDYRSSSAPMS